MPANAQLRLAVTGRNGQIARALQSCAGAGLNVLPVARPELDLSSAEDPTALFRQYSPDVIVNAAAYTAVDKAESEPELARTINARGALLVARAAAQLDIPIIQISTDYVFDGTATRPYREDDATSPINVYGATKLEGEHAVRSTTTNHVILRTSWIYAAEGTNFVRTMLRLAEQRDEIAVVDDQRGAPTSAHDIAPAIAVLARRLVDSPHDASLRGVFHMTNKGEATWADFATEIFKISKAQGGPSARVNRIATAEFPTAARRPMYSILDLSKISQIEDISMRHWTEALQSAMKVYARLHGAQ